MHPLIVSDSRGRFLSQYISGYTDIVCEIAWYPGAGIDRLTNRAITKLNGGDYNIVVIMGGVCDITSRNSTTRVTTITTPNIECTVERVSSLMHEGVSALQNRYPDIKVMFVPVVGIDLNYYSRLPGTSPQQTLLNEIIIKTNQKITEINLLNNIPTPWTHTLVHHNKGRGKVAHRYQHLTDGCHYGSQANDWVANALVQALHKVR